ncbi:MAG: L,D-transpeptidase family protein [Actinomycetota bacterium]|nr:L,D-transpeptidase family protein [Actinomycetota bacterium]
MVLTLASLALGACAPAPAARPSSGATTPAPTASSTPGAPGPTSGSATTTASAPGPTTPTTTTPTSTTSTTSTKVAALTAGATGERVRELQARLTQIAWFTGPMTGTYDATTVAGVRGFQDKRTLPVTGTTDDATWAALAGMTRLPTGDEMHNVLHPGPALLRQGATGAAVRDLQARLKQIGWWSGVVGDTYGAQTTDAVRQFQAKRAIPVTGEVDQRTTDRLRGMTRIPTSDELTNTVPKPPTGTTAGLDHRCLTGRVLCISKASRSLTWVVDGQARMRVDVRFGSENNPTREGVFSVFRKNREWTSTIYGSSMPFSMFFSGGEAVHYSSDFAARGYAGASHGCVNVRDYSALSTLFGLVQVGDTVVVS